MSFKTWLSIITLILVGVIIFFSRDELLQAWKLLGGVNIWILMLLIPIQMVVYYIGGETMFSYLRAKGTIKEIPAGDLTQMALEMNFVNHVLPSGGVSGISYMTWRLSKYGIPAGRAAMAQLVRFAMTFLAYILIVLVAIVAITIDGNINRWVIFISFTMVIVLLLAGVGGAYVLGGRQRMWKAAGFVVKHGNRLVKRLTFGRKKRTFRYAEVEKFFTDMHFDYTALKTDRKILARPLMWGGAYAIGDVLMYLITFWAMGIIFNPAPLFIAYGVASISGFIVVTPGGTGAFEAMMVGFLALSGLDKSEAIAGVVLTRVIALLGTIIFGYVFYQKAILKYGKYDAANSRR